MKVLHIVHKIRSLKKGREHKEGREQKSKTTLISGVVIVLAVIVALGIVSNWTFFLGSSLSADEAKTKTEQFIFSSNLSGGKKVEIKEISSAGTGLYKIMVQLEGAPSLIESYVTKDGKLFFPNVMKIDPTGADKISEATKDVPKSDKPRVELFVMSYCPFGTQIEKGIIPVLETLGNSIDFQLKFVDYTLHGKKEFDENTRQYCIEKEYPKNLIGYLKCFNGENSDTCLAQNAMSATRVNECILKADKTYKLSETYKSESPTREGNSSFPIHASENEMYGVEGSPALVLNGVKIDSARDSATLLNMICSAFDSEPEVCSTKLSNTPPGVGFGDTPTSASSGDCN